MPSTSVCSAVRDWLASHADEIPQYCGAHLVGSASMLPADESAAGERD